ncbi:MAG: hypothetical protein U0X76_10850 [Bacteroidia bacterium]
MLSHFNKLLLFTLAVAGAYSCKKETVTFEAVPSIEYVSITPANAHQYTDNVTITIKYKDGDGDLGENNSDVKNCFVTDNRIGVTYKFRIKQLAPSGSSVPIEGNLDIQLGGQGITNGSSSQSASYSVYVVDRAGHESNVVNTGEIVISD